MLKTILKLIITVLCISVVSGAHALPPSTSEYVNDPQTTYNNDDTTDTFNLIKIVACMIKNTKPELQAGKGKYVAWIGTNTCEDRSSSTGSDKRFDKAMIESGSNAQGQLVVRMWLESQNDDTNNGVTTWTTQYYFVNVNITAGVNIAPPLGNWTINFCRVPNINSSSCTDYGFAKVTPTDIKVYNKSLWNDGTLVTRQGAITYVLSNGEIQTGKGSIQINEDASQSTYHNQSRDLYTRFAFKDGFYYSRIYGQNNDICYDRIADNGFENVWETWLYTPLDGKRLVHNSGMSIKKSTTDNSNNNRGWASYWGIWFPENNNPAVGSTVYADVSGQTNKPFKYSKTIGSVNKNIIKKGVLADIAEVPLMVSMPVSTAGIYSTSETIRRVRVKWSATSSAFQVQAVDGSSVVGTPTLTFAQLLAGQSYANNWTSNNSRNYNPTIGMNQEGTSNWYELTLADGWGQSIVDSTSNKQPGCVWVNNMNDCNVKLRTTAAARYVLRSQYRVLPGTADAIALANMGNLKCTGNCFNQDGTQNSGQVKVSLAPVYSYNAVTGVMSIVSNGVSTPISKPPSNSTQWSGETEPLLAVTDTANLANAVCQNYDPFTTTTADFYCGWKLKDNSSSFTYYSYQTSPQSWADTDFLLDESVSPARPLIFDEPINTVYTVEQTKSSLNNKVVNIQYQGNGQLNLPGHCYSRSQDKSIDCGNWSGDTFYINDFIVPPWTKSLNDYASDPSLAAKTRQATLTNVTNSTTYLTKWLRKGVIFRTVASNSCTGLTIPAVGEITLPGLPDWSNPALSTSSTYIGTWQSPTGNPVYVDGVKQ